MFKPIYTVFFRKYWMDELYEKIFVRGILLNGIFRGFHAFDSGVIDGAANGIGNGAMKTGGLLSKAQSGQLQAYGLFVAIGIIAIVVGFLIFK